MADLNYYESGYIDASYFVYTADAESAITSSATMSCSVGKVTSAESAMSAAFTQTTYGSRTKDIDLYAFSEAAIAVQVSAIRTTNIAATAVFDISTDGRRFRDISSAEDAAFTFASQAERSRATSMETQAAFSIIADGDLIGAALEGAANLTVESSLSIPGERTLEISSNQSSSSTISVSGSKTSATVVTLDTQATISATISHIHGADLTAFSNASISALAEVIKTTVVDLTSNFSVTPLADRIRQGSSNLSLEIQISTQVETLKTSESTVNSSVTLDVDVEKISDTSSIIESIISITIDNSRIRYNDSQLSFESTLSAILSNTRGVDIVATGFANISIDPVVSYDSTVNLNSTISLNSLGGKIFETSSILQSKFIIYASRYFGSGRPRNITQISLALDSTNKKFGTHSLSYSGSAGIRGDNNVLNSYTQTAKLHESFVFEAWYYNTSYYEASGGGFGVGLNRLLSHWWIYPESTGAITLYQSNNATPFAYYAVSSNPSVLSLNSWNHILLVADPAVPYITGQENGQISLYLNGSRILQSPRYSTTSFANDYHTYDYLYIRDLGTNGRLDDVSLHIGSTLGYSTSSTTVSVPTSQRINNPTYTRLLWHLDGNGNDDTSVLQIASSSISSQSSITATLTGPQYFSANLVTQFNQVLYGSVDRGADLSAFTNAALSITGTRIQEGSGALEVESSQSTVAVKTTDIVSTQSSEFTQTSDVVKTVDVSITTDAVASELAIVAKVGDFVIACDVTSRMDVISNKTTDVTSTQNNETTLSSVTNKITDVISAQSVEVSQSVVNSRTRDIPLTINSSATQTSSISKFVGFDADLSATVTLEANTSGTIDFIALVMSSGSLDTTANRIRDISSNQSSEFTQTTNTFDSLAKQGSATIDSEATVDFIIHRIRDTSISTDAIASELVAISKIGQGIITSELYSTISVFAEKITDVQSVESSQTVLEVTGSKILATANVVMSATTNLDAEGTTNITGEAQINSASNLAVDSSRTRDNISNLTVVSNIYCNTSRIRPFAELVVSAATLSSTINRVRDSSIQISAFAFELASGDSIIGGEATLSAAFGMVVEGRDIDIKKYVYKIDRETRFYSIHSENRTKNIREETRIYKIRRV